MRLTNQTKPKIKCLSKVFNYIIYDWGSFSTIFLHASILKHPTLNQVTVEDIVPLHKQTLKSDPTRMKDPDPTIHPDSDTRNRYVMGTRLQGNLQKSHKLKTCRYHNIDLAANCEDVKTMTQESMQNVRRHRTIQADKLRSIECSFLANILIDFKHNEKKTRKQRQIMLNSFGVVERDPDTRVIFILTLFTNHLKRKREKKLNQ